MGWVLEREGAGITIQKTTESWVCRAGDFLRGCEQNDEIVMLTGR